MVRFGVKLAYQKKERIKDMKKVIRLIFVGLIILSTMIILCACGSLTKSVVKKTAIDSRYKAAYTEVVTDYQHKYSWYHGDFKLVPNVHSVTHPESYEILYLIEYDDGTTCEQWQAVEHSIYSAFIEKGKKDNK